jgi:hypothetical protein
MCLWSNGHDGGRHLAASRDAVRGRAIDSGTQADEDTDAELAFARLAWARAARCLELPSQRDALVWLHRETAADNQTNGGTTMGGKNKGGREVRKPKQDQNKKSKGQTPTAGGVEAAVKAPPPRGSK